MSSRPPANAATPAGYRQDDERRRDEARAVTAQNQIDELRQVLRELSSRQIRQEEQGKLGEGGLAQLRILLDQFRQEFQQSAQARALDENRTRQQVGDLEARLEDQTRPIRSIQAHVTELLEASRKKVDDSSQSQKRFDELRSMIEHLSAQGDRNAVVTHQLRDSIDANRAEMDALRRDIIRAEDATKIVDQDVRRRMAEAAQINETVGARFDELRSDQAHLLDTLEETQRAIVHVDPSLDELRAADLTLRQDLLRFQTQAVQRHDLLMEREDDVRQDTDARFDELRQNLENRAERLGERIEEFAGTHRDLTYRYTTLANQLEEQRQIDAALRRDIWYLHEQRVRIRLEQIQEELDLATTQRRDAESEAETGSVLSRYRPRPTGDDLDH
ncbi:MAG: hypothetical protein H0T49_09910 [Chloroflexia bacterium]|nr:hypothetical protein [Chloroflexia bacterium]